MKNKVKVDYTRILSISIVAAIVLGILLILLGNYRDYTEVKLSKNNKTIFTISDLTVDKVKYGDYEKDIVKKMGKPKKVKKETKNVYSYRKYYYKDLVLILKENYDDYMLVGAEVTGRNYNVSRNIKVGNRIKSVMNKFNVENQIGTYIYGNYSKDALNEKEITGNIYQGIRSKEKIEYINRDSIVNDGIANTARLTINYKKGRVSKIVWSYDYE